jgi:hypothetical protein
MPRQFDSETQPVKSLGEQAGQEYPTIQYVPTEEEIKQTESVVDEQERSLQGEVRRLRRDAPLASDDVLTLRFTR